MSYFSEVADLLQTVNFDGLYRGRTAKAFHITGRRSGFNSTSVLQDCSEVLGTTTDAVADLAGTETLEIVSSSAADAAAGTGVRTVKITYINASNALVESAAITMNGVTPVATGITAKCLLWVEATTVGSGNVAAGNIVVRNTVGPVNYIQITAGGNKSLAAVFMVPAGYTGYVTDWGGNAISTTQDMRLRATVGTYARDLQVPYHFMSNLYLASGSGGEEVVGFLKLPALCRVKVSTIAGATAAANRLDASFNIVIVAD